MTSSRLVAGETRRSNEVDRLKGSRGYRDDSFESHQAAKSGAMDVDRNLRLKCRESTGRGLEVDAVPGGHSGQGCNSAMCVHFVQTIQSLWEFGNPVAIENFVITKRFVPANQPLTRADARFWPQIVILVVASSSLVSHPI